jgi:hypothetical protein
MTSLACSRCGAPVSLPADLAAYDVQCGFCRTRTPLPPELLGLRLREHQELVEQQRQAAAQAQGAAVTRKTMSLVLWIVVISVAVPLLITIAVLIFVAVIATQAVPHLPHR